MAATAKQDGDAILAALHLAFGARRFNHGEAAHVLKWAYREMEAFLIGAVQAKRLLSEPGPRGGPGFRFPRAEVVEAAAERQRRLDLLYHVVNARGDTRLNAWQENFLVTMTSILNTHPHPELALSEKQWAKVDEIAAQLEVENQDIEADDDI